MLHSQKELITQVETWFDTKMSTLENIGLPLESTRGQPMAMH